MDEISPVPRLVTTSGTLYLDAPNTKLFLAHAPAIPSKERSKVSLAVTHTPRGFYLTRRTRLHHFSIETKSIARPYYDRDAAARNNTVHTQMRTIPMVQLVLSTHVNDTRTSGPFGQLSNEQGLAQHSKI